MRALRRISFGRFLEPQIHHVRPSLPACSLRHAHIQAAPSCEASETLQPTPDSVATPDAVFEVLGNPYSLLSVSLSPSQPLHTRRGSLTSFSGDPTTAVSTLRFLPPLRRILSGIPFLYQRLTTTSPATALISPRSTNTSLAVLHLSGTTDWKICQRKSLLAWTGSSLILSPSFSQAISLPLAYAPGTSLTGRGLVALEGKGNIFSVDLAQDESYIIHPSNLMAYSIPPDASASTKVQPFRFKSTLIFSVPALYQFTSFFPTSKFLMNIRRDSDTYKLVASIFHRIRTWSRRVIWGDRLFLRFTGPTTLLIQSRASRIRDVLTDGEVNEISDTPTGSVQRAFDLKEKTEISKIEANKSGRTHSEPEIKKEPPKMSIASVGSDGKVTLEKTDNFGQLKNREPTG